MKDELMQVECDPSCGFLVRSHDIPELKRMVVSHSKNAHNKNISEKDVDAFMRPAS